MKATAYTPQGEATDQDVELPEEFFDGTVNRDVLHQVVTAIQARGRQGTASTKTRGTITGGGRKPWRQKGTGRARHGSIRSPIWRGGAVTFGPQPRDYDPKVPKKMNRLAVRSALNARAMEDRLSVVEELDLEEPRTKSVVELLQGIGVDQEKVLLLTDGHKKVVYLSARNLPEVEVRPWGQASAYDVLRSDHVIVERGALVESGTDADDDEEDER
jgi:large subunit ribosomal protein L4